MAEKMSEHGYLLLANICEQFEKRIELLSPSHVSSEEFIEIKKTLTNI